ncbi:acyl-CoA dehydrogenase family protein [bacterium]|nr:acyl-CoA dehydrogenase family protein [bacterium]
MDFELTRENVMIKNAIRDWVSKECTREIVSELDEKGEYPKKLIKKLAKLGFGGMIIPEEYDGEGKNILGACLVVEEIAYAYPALANCYISPTFFGGAVISELGSNSQKEKYLPKIARDSIITSLAFSEQNDADAEIISTTAEKQGDFYTLKGSKAYVSLANQADLLIVLARTSTPENSNDLTLFCVDTKTVGLAIETVETMGYQGAGFCNTKLNDVVLPAEAILGGVGQLGQGRKQMEKINDFALLAYAASAVGMSQGAFDYALQHAKQREQFGVAIGRFPAIGHLLTEVACKIEAARLMVYRAAWMADKGKNCSKEIAMAKCIGAEVAVKSAMNGLQILGGYGYTMEYDIQRYVRDSIALLSTGKSMDSLKEKIGASFGLA